MREREKIESKSTDESSNAILISQKILLSNAWRSKNGFRTFTKPKPLVHLLIHVSISSSGNFYL